MNTNSPESNHNVYQTDPFHHTDEQDVAFTTIHTENNSSDKKENICDQIEYYRHRYPRLELGLKLIYQVIAGFFMLMFLFYFIGNFISLINTLQNLYEFVGENINAIVGLICLYLILLGFIVCEVWMMKSEKPIYRFMWLFWLSFIILIFVSVSSKQEMDPLKNEALFNENYFLFSFVLFLFFTFCQYVKHYIKIRDNLVKLRALNERKEHINP